MPDLILNDFTEISNQISFFKNGHQESQEITLDSEDIELSDTDMNTIRPNIIFIDSDSDCACE